MKILYRQSSDGRDPGAAFLQSMGVKQCYFKHLFTARDAEKITTKRHHHTHYEIHMVESGCVCYELAGVSCTLGAGQFILLPPRTPHRVSYRQADTSTLSVTFCPSEDPGLLPDLTEYVTGQFTDGMGDTIALALAEYSQGKYGSSQIIAAALAQLLLSLWRLCGAQQRVAPEESPEEDPRLTMAVQFIQDNIEYAPTLGEVSAYCHLSSKQLTRLFRSARNVTPSEYIRSVRIRQIEALLKEPCLSLRDVSERMHFSSEYYFSAFFKQYAGMTPGEFRKMHRSDR